MVNGGRIIEEADVADRLVWPQVVEALREGHRGSPAQVGDQFLIHGDDTLLSRAAWIPGLGIGVKSVSVLPGNAAAGHPTIQGAMVVFDDATGAMKAVIDAQLVTRWKTAADSLLGALLLAPLEPERLVIVGAGTVADSLVEGYRAIFPSVTDIAIHNRTRDRAERLAEKHGVRVSDDLEADVSRADIVSTATLSQQPILNGEWVSASTHVDLIGAFTASMREADDVLLRKARLFVDSRETTLDHIGELMIPLREGVITCDDVLGDLRDLVAGRVEREGDEITLFKNGGGAHLDLMTARVIMEAVEGGDNSSE